MDGGPPLFKIWLEQDVVWIVTPGERTAFKLLQNDEQRDEFVEAFGSGAIPLPIPARMQSKTNPSASCLCQRTALARESRMEDGPGANLYADGPPDRITTPDCPREPAGRLKTVRTTMGSQRL